MTNELNDLVPAQEKLEWVTPKISLMDAGDTDGKTPFSTRGAGNKTWSLLTNYTSNPAIPAKLNPTNGSAKTLVGELCSFAALIAWHAFC
jgi:hypothetical protein